MKPKFKNKFPNFQVLTYSALQAFRNCRKKYDYRYNQELVPIEREEVLHFGSVWHQVLETWYRRDPEYMFNPREAIQEALELIDESFPNRQDEKSKANSHLLRAMFKAYVETYPTEEFDVLYVEEEFGANLRNYRRCKPLVKSKHSYSRTFGIAGKADAIVQHDNQFFIMEHKTASVLSSSYLERLPMDMQIHLYARFVERTFDIPIAGIIYNIAVKAKLQQKRGESEEEYEIRKAELIAKSKTGKSSAKRRMPESDEAFEERLLEKYREPGMFHREVLYLAQDDLERIEREVWDMTEELKYVRRRGLWVRNPEYCFHYNKPCSYFPLCRSNDSPLVREKFFTTEPAHNELDSIETEVDSVF